MKFNKEFKLFESKYDIIDLQILYRDEKRIKAKFEGVAKPMSEKGFNKKQIEQLADIVSNIIDKKVPGIVTKIIDEKVPGIVTKIIDEKVPDIVTKIIDEKVPGIVKNIVDPEFKKINNRLDVLEQDVNQLKQDVHQLKQDVNQLKQDVKAIKSCPTIQKELSLVQ